MSNAPEADPSTVKSELSRRTVTRSAAWSVPIIAAVVAAPAASASVIVPQDVIVSASCYGLNILGFGFSFPQFTIEAQNVDILPGSTFTITGSGVGNLTFGGYAGLNFNFVGTNSALVTTTEVIPAGTSTTVQVTGLASFQALAQYTLSVTSIIGNRNNIPTNDSASANLSGFSFLGVLGGLCTA